MKATRVGIELSPTACRIVEVDRGVSWPGPRRDTRVRSFAVLPPSGPETRARLHSLRNQPAAVVVWGGRAEHRQVVVTAGSYESMRAEAMASLSAVNVQTSGMWADIAPASRVDERSARRTVIVSMASASEMTEALQPLREAGIRLRTVTTPAVALASLARMRRAISVPDAIESYIALDEAITCIALVRNGVLLAARELPWGFVDAGRSLVGPRSREELTARLADAMSTFAAEIGASPRDLGQVCVCGGLPELRSMSVLLLERQRRRGDLLLEVDVEPLDSLFGIDAARLPEPADEFRERAAELRLAWAAAAEWPPVINLLRAHRRRLSQAWLARAAVVAGAAAGLGGSWWMVARGHVWPAQRPAVRSASTASARGRGPTPPAPSAPRVSPPSVALKAPSAAVSVPAVAAKAPSPTVSVPPVAVQAPSAAASVRPAVTNVPPAVANAPPPVAAPSPAVGRILANPVGAGASQPATRATMPVVAPSAGDGRLLSGPVAGRSAPVPRAMAPAAGPPPAVGRGVPDRAVAGRTGPPQRPTRPVARKRAPGPEVALPFDAVLGTILYSTDRKLAIIDNRVVGVGDEVRGARIIEITPAAVLLRDGRGQLKGLFLGAAER